MSNWSQRVLERHINSHWTRPATCDGRTTATARLLLGLRLVWESVLRVRILEDLAGRG